MNERNSDWGKLVFFGMFGFLAGVIGTYLAQEDNRKQAKKLLEEGKEVSKEKLNQLSKKVVKLKKKSQKQVVDKLELAAIKLKEVK